MCQYLRMFAAIIMMASSVAAHAEQIDYNPAKVSDSLKAIFQFGSVSTKKALNANTVTLLTGTIGGTYVQFGADLASILDDGGNLRVLPIVGRGSVQSVADILFLRASISASCAPTRSTTSRRRALPATSRSGSQRTMPGLAAGSTPVVEHTQPNSRLMLPFGAICSKDHHNSPLNTFEQTT